MRTSPKQRAEWRKWIADRANDFLANEEITDLLDDIDELIAERREYTRKGAAIAQDLDECRRDKGILQARLDWITAERDALKARNEKLEAVAKQAKKVFEIIYWSGDLVDTVNQDWTQLQNALAALEEP